jgi:polyhydroxybutyrate depolymerase
LSGTFQFGGTTRTYVIHLPATYGKHKQRVPLVLAFHGGGGRSGRFETLSRLSEKADKEGFVVVYPDGMLSQGALSIRTWNAGKCCNPKASLGRQADDVGFVSALIDELAKTYRIDTKRVYATGHSNGAMFCYRLACELSNKIAAIAPNAGTIQLQQPCQPARVVPVIHFQSKLDKNVPYQGGFGTRGISNQWNPSVDSTLSVFANLTPGKPTRQTVETTPVYTYYRWVKSDQDTSPIECYLTEDGGHSWPGGNQGAVLSSDPPSVLSANDLMWAFFKRYTIP